MSHYYSSIVLSDGTTESDLFAHIRSSVAAVISDSVRVSPCVNLSPYNPMAFESYVSVLQSDPFESALGVCERIDLVRSIIALQSAGRVFSGPPSV